MSAEISDGDLVRLARDGDQVAFRLLVERHQPMARARAWRLGPNPSDVDDIVQESLPSTAPILFPLEGRT